MNDEKDIIVILKYFFLFWILYNNHISKNKAQ